MMLWFALILLLVRAPGSECRLLPQDQLLNSVGLWEIFTKRSEENDHRSLLTSEDSKVDIAGGLSGDSESEEMRLATVVEKDGANNAPPVLSLTDFARLTDTNLKLKTQSSPIGRAVKSPEGKTAPATESDRKTLPDIDGSASLDFERSITSNFKGGQPSSPSPTINAQLLSSSSTIEAEETTIRPMDLDSRIPPDFERSVLTNFKGGHPSAPSGQHESFPTHIPFKKATRSAPSTNFGPEFAVAKGGTPSSPSTIGTYAVIENSKLQSRRRPPSEHTSTLESNLKGGQPSSPSQTGNLVIENILLGRTPPSTNAGSQFTDSKGGILSGPGTSGSYIASESSETELARLPPNSDSSIEHNLDRTKEVVQTSPGNSVVMTSLNVESTNFSSLISGASSAAEFESSRVAVPENSDEVVSCISPVTYDTMTQNFPRFMSMGR